MPSAHRKISPLVQIALILLSLLAILAVAALWMLAPRSVPPAPDWTARWNALMPEFPDGAVDAFEVLNDIDNERQSIARAMNGEWLPMNPEDRQYAVRDAVWVAAHGEWIEPWRTHATEALVAQESVIDRLIAMSQPPLTARYAIDSPPPASFDEWMEYSNSLYYSDAHAPIRFSSEMLTGEFRRAELAGDHERAIASLDALLYLSELSARRGTVIGAVFSFTHYDTATRAVAAIASARNASPETLRAALAAFDNYPPPSIDAAQLRATEQITGEVQLWGQFIGTRNASMGAVAESLWVSLTDPSMTEEPPLWVRRRLRYEDALEFHSVYLDYYTDAFALPLDELDLHVTPPRFDPAPALFPEDSRSLFKRLRTNHAALEIKTHWRRALISIALYQAENGRPPATLLDAMSADDATAIHVGLPYRYALSENAPGYELRLPDTPWYERVLKQPQRGNLERDLEGLLLTPYRPIEPDNLPSIVTDAPR